MKSICILGATYNQIPLVEKAQELGYRAIVIGAGEAKPAAAEAADLFLPIDTADHDTVLDLAKREDIRGLVTCGTSTAICTCAYVTEKLSLSRHFISYAASLNAVYKDRFRRLLGDLTPKGVIATSFEDALAKQSPLTYPLAFKPADGGGGKGISRVNTDDHSLIREAFSCARRHSRTTEVVIEEFIDGPILGVESMVFDGHVHVMTIADKLIHPAARNVTLGVLFPSALPTEIQQRVLKANAEAIRRLGIQWGPTHIDMAIDKEGEPRIIDIGPRLAGGAIMARLVPSKWNYDVYGATIRLALGELPDPPKACNNSYYGSYFLTTDQRGTLSDMEIPEGAFERHCITSSRRLRPNGVQLEGVEHDGARLMMITTETDSYDSARRQLLDFVDEVTIRVTPAESDKSQD